MAYESTLAPFHVSVWEERDRLHISLKDRDDETVAEWWDEDAQQMFEDGFFESGRGLSESVIAYAVDMKIIPPREEWAEYEDEDDEDDEDEDE